MSNIDNKQRISFAAINPYLQDSIVSPKETIARGKDMVDWGEGNSYPDYLLSLYNSVATLRSIINGNVDFITGDDVTIAPLRAGFDNGCMNMKGDTIREQVRTLAWNYQVYGGFALQIIRNFAGEVPEVYPIDLRHLRTNKEKTVFYYCEDYNKKGYKDTIVYPAFLPRLDWAKLTDEERNRHASSILYVSNTDTQVYPAPIYAAAVKACEIERNIDDYHINTLENQFTPSAMVNFCNGIPDDEVKEAIERDFTEKFSGHQNAGRIIFSWNPDKDSATTITETKIEDFGARYEALAKHSRQQIFCSFRAVPALFGINPENNGFSETEYEGAFKLYNRTQIQPVQRTIAEAYEKIYGAPKVLTIIPFTLSGETEDNIR